MANDSRAWHAAIILALIAAIAVLSVLLVEVKKHECPAATPAAAKVGAGDGATDFSLFACSEQKLCGCDCKCSGLMCCRAHSIPNICGAAMTGAKITQGEACTSAEAKVNSFVKTNYGGLITLNTCSGTWDSNAK